VSQRKPQQSIQRKRPNSYKYGWKYEINSITRESRWHLVMKHRNCRRVPLASTVAILEWKKVEGPLWREELQLPVTIKRSFLSSYKWQKMFERYRQLRLFPKQILCQSYFMFWIIFTKWIWFVVSSVFRMEMFDLRAKELKYAKELLRNYYRKSVQNSVRLQGMWVELKL